MQLDIKALTGDIAGVPGFDRYRLTTGKKDRLIDDPNAAMREIHRRLIGQVRAQRTPNRFETAGPGGSIARNVEPHRGHRYVVAYDLHNAYPRVRANWLIELFADVDGQVSLLEDQQNADMIAFLRDHCLLPSGYGLRTGAPASPDLFNLYAQWVLDFRLANICRRYGITFTRYMDDLTFSCSQVIGKQKRAKIREAIWKAGFCVTRSKAQVVDLYKPDPATGAYPKVTITGICLDRNGRLSLPGPKLRQFEQKLHHALQGRGDPKKLRAQVDGIMGHFHMVHPIGSTLTPREERIETLYRRYMGLTPRKRSINFRTGNPRPEFTRR